MTYPGVIFWLLAIWSMASRGPGLYYLFFISWSLGTLAVIPPQLAGGNFTPAWVAAGLLTARVILDEGPRAYFRALTDIRRFGILSLCVGYAVMSGLFLPRFFEGQVKVVEMRLLKTADPVPLEPSLANFNQTLYFVLSALVVVDVYFICRKRKTRDPFLIAFAWGGAFAVVSGLLDLGASKAGLGGLLTPFRNAAYAMMLDNDALDMHRIIGLMSEASAYAGLCLPFLSLLGLAPQIAGPWGRWSLWLGAALAIMTYLSTSSSGYVSLAGFAAALGVSLVLGMAQGRRAAWFGGYGALVAVTLGVGTALLAPKLIDTVYRVIDGMVLHKTQSESYIQRSAWNTAAISAFYGTDGLGVGAGSARASSWPIALLANIGIPGTVLLTAFIMHVLMMRADTPRERLLGRAAKLGLFPNLLMLSLSGTSISFGLGISLLLGLIAGAAREEAPALNAAGALGPFPHKPDRPRIVGVLVDHPFHAVMLSSASPIVEPVPSVAKAWGRAPAGPGLDSMGELIGLIEELEQGEPAERFMHLMLYGPADPALRQLGAWIAAHPRWSVEHLPRVQIDTRDWLRGVLGAVEPTATPPENALLALGEAPRLAWTVFREAKMAAGVDPLKSAV